MVAMEIIWYDDGNNDGDIGEVNDDDDITAPDVMVVITLPWIASLYMWRWLP